MSALFTVCIIFSVFTFAADEEYDSSIDPLISYSYLEARIGELKTDYENEITDLILENEALKNEIASVQNSYDSLLDIVNELVIEIDALKKGDNSGGNNGGGNGNAAVDEDAVKEIAESVAKDVAKDIAEGIAKDIAEDVAEDVSTNVAAEIVNNAITGITPAGSEFVAVFVSEGGIVYPKGNSLEVILRSGNAVVVSPFENQGLSNITNGTDMANGKSITLNHQLLIPRNDGRGVKIISTGGAYVMIRGEYIIG